ncbi:hypothetical protein EMCRGX_G012319 [Ephydatia muelleri]
MILFIPFSISGFIFQIASAQSFSCDADVSKPLCLGTVVTCTCRVTGTVSQTWWTFSALCYNKIPFRQVAPCSPASGTCGPYITATNLASSASNCQTSKLFVTMANNVSGQLAECRDMSVGLPGTLIGSASFKIKDAPDQPMIVNSSVGTHQLTVTWTPPTAGGVPTSYNVTINDSSSPVVIADNGSPVYTHTFTGLVSDTLYTVSVVAINCAGHNKTLLGSSESSHLVTARIQVPTEGVSTYVAITCIVSFFVGILVAIFVFCVWYILRKSPLEVPNPPPPPPPPPPPSLPQSHLSISVPLAYKATMGTDKQKRNETVSAVESIELDSNVAYGTVL